MFRIVLLTLLLIGGQLVSAQVIPNGDFTGPSNTSYNGWPPPGWSTTIQSPDTWAAGTGPNGFSAPASPNGGTFVRTNGYGPEGMQAVVTGLTIGQPFTIDFWYAEACISLSPSPGVGGYVFNMFGVNQLTPVVSCNTPAVWVPGSVTFMPTATSGMLTITTQALGGHSHTLVDGASVGVVLPIDGVEFQVSPRQDRTLTIDWTAEQEDDNVHFYVVERSADGIVWDFFERQEALGQALAYYRTEDPDPLAGESFYRLKSMGHDGHAKYSEIRSVNFDEPVMGDLLIYPNPTEGEVTVVGNAVELGQIRVFDMMGKEHTRQVRFHDEDENHRQLDLGGLASGIYLIRTATAVKRVRVR